MIFLKPVLMVWVLWFGSYPIFSQQMNSNSARALAVGNTSSVISDEWGAIQNPGGLEFADFRHNVILSYHNRYLEYGIHDGNFGYGIAFGKFNLAATVSYFGDNLLNQTKTGLVAAHKSGFAQFGLRVNHHQVRLDGYGSSNAFSFDIGGLFQFSPQFLIGLELDNVSQSKYLGEQENTVPSIMKLGLAYIPIEQLRLQLQLDKDLSADEDLRAGIEYDLNSTIRIATGLSFLNPVAHGGVGLNLKNITLDLAGQYHLDIGFSGMFSSRIGFQIK